MLSASHILTLQNDIGKLTWIVSHMGSGIIADFQFSAMSMVVWLWWLMSFQTHLEKNYLCTSQTSRLK